MTKRFTCVNIKTAAGFMYPPKKKIIATINPAKKDKMVVTKKVGTRGLGRAHPCKRGGKHGRPGCTTVGVLFAKAVTYARDVKRAWFDPVHHLWFGSSQQPRRGRIPWVVFKEVIRGVAVRCITFIELQRVFVWDMSPGARL